MAKTLDLNGDGNLDLLYAPSSGSALPAAYTALGKSAGPYDFDQAAKDNLIAHIRAMDWGGGIEAGEGGEFEISGISVSRPVETTTFVAWRSPSTSRSLGMTPSPPNGRGGGGAAPPGMGGGGGAPPGGNAAVGAGRRRRQFYGSVLAARRPAPLTPPPLPWPKPTTVSYTHLTLPTPPYV